MAAEGQVPSVFCSSQARFFGITRVGDLTDLDVIGIPVWFAARPNSRTLAVSQGKGLTHEHARISAIMESIESAVAECTAELVSEFGSATEMSKRGHISVPFCQIDRCNYAFFSYERERAWVRGIDIVSMSPIYAPYELVGLDLRPHFPWDHNCFHIGSAGLAAGPTFEFAAAAALLELIERDTTALHDIFGVESAFSRRVHWEGGVNLGLDEAMMKLANAGLDAHLFVANSRAGFPTFSAIISRPVLHERGGGVRYSSGFACRLNPAEAALAAILEAVQSRLTNIAGSRDDLAEEQYEPLIGNVSSCDQPNGQGLSELKADFLSDSFIYPADKYRIIIDRLMQGGFKQIFLFDLPTNMDGVHVVRALVPGLRSGSGDFTSVNPTELHSLLNETV